MKSSCNYFFNKTAPNCNSVVFIFSVNKELQYLHGCPGCSLPCAFQSCSISQLGWCEVVKQNLQTWRFSSPSTIPHHQDFVKTKTPQWCLGQVRSLYIWFSVVVVQFAITGTITSNSWSISHINNMVLSSSVKSRHGPIVGIWKCILKTANIIPSTISLVIISDNVTNIIISRYTTTSWYRHCVLFGCLIATKRSLSLIEC